MVGIADVLVRHKQGTMPVACELVTLSRVCPLRTRVRVIRDVFGDNGERVQAPSYLLMERFNLRVITVININTNSGTAIPFGGQSTWNLSNCPQNGTAVLQELRLKYLY